MEYDHKVKCIIPSNELLQLQNLETIIVDSCGYVEEIFGTNEGTNSESEIVIEIPNLRQVKLWNLESLKYIWKSNHHQRRVLKFPNLTTLSIGYCHSLKHVFTSSMMGGLLQLQDLQVTHCYNMEQLNWLLLYNYSLFLWILPISNPALSFGAFIHRLTMPPRREPPSMEDTLAAMLEELKLLHSDSSKNHEVLLTRMNQQSELSANLVTAVAKLYENPSCATSSSIMPPHQPPHIPLPPQPSPQNPLSPAHTGPKPPKITLPLFDASKSIHHQT
ncbi:hypothetical protein E3N88_00051 [Mikania micrantha]|uniref:Disease resistance protein At4g27190-like leucine-rich repeats domain-containing protein n=1 Tax=Mikania micrantha TaxID=192012 RepID=A0A5N6PWZ4_9ASTR|nr:hypothetical protein E3N88_00051 [Mikania micrantha]